MDAVVVGEGERVWSQLLRDLDKGEIRKVYEGGFPPLDYIKLYPDRSLFKDKYQYRYSSIITTKGCPWKCEFCSVPLSGKVANTAERDVEDVLDEMAASLSRADVRRGQLLRLPAGFECARPSPVPTDGGARHPQGLVRIHAVQHRARPDALRHMSESGCLGFLIGMESTDEQVLRKLRKGSNIKTGVSNYPSAIRNIHDSGMIVWASVIWGADFQNKDCFKPMTDYILEHSIDVLTFGIHCPFPETALFKRMVQENRMLRPNFPDDWSTTTPPTSPTRSVI